MKKVIVLSIVVAMFLALFSIATPIARLSNSIPVAKAGTQSNIDVDTLIKHKIIQGYPDGSLHLERITTRAEFAKMITMSFSLEYLPMFNLEEYSFTDTSKNFWGSPYIEPLAKAGVIKGFPDGTFKPNNPITLEEAVVILSRALGVPDLASDDSLSKFSDASLIHSWAKNYFNFMVSREIVEGNSDGTLDPLHFAIREEIMHFIASTRFPIITILNTNDFHMYLLGKTDKETKKPIGGSARIATIVNNERAYNSRTLLVDAGDAIGGGPPIGAFFYGKNVIETYNTIGYDVATLGNHEFDWGQDLLKERISEAEYQYVSANIFDTKTNSTFVDPYVVKSFGLVDIQVTGVDTVDLPVLVHPKGLEGLEITDPVDSVNNLQKVGDYVVVLSHLGYGEDKNYLAPNVEDVNLIIGGHTHTALEEPEVVNGIPIIQAGSYGTTIGKVVLEFETSVKDGTKLLSFSYELIPVDDTVEENAEIKALIAPYEEKLSKKMDEVIGEVLVDLDGERANIRSMETNLGDFIADWMKEVSGADIAIANGGGIRASIPKGPLTVGSIYTVLPFDNLLVLLEVTGQQVLDALENGFSQVEKGGGRFPQISGMRVKVNLSNPVSERVIEVTVNGEPLNLEKVYKLVTNDFMAAGGDGYAMFAEAESSEWVTGNWMRDDLIEYIKENPEVSKEVDGRITIEAP